MQTTVIRELDQLEGLRDAWNLAVESSNYDSVFLRHEWFCCWAKHFIPPSSMFVVLAWDGDRIIGILPLQVEERHRRIWNEVVLSSMSNPHTFKYNFVLQKGNAEEILNALLDRVSAEISWTTMDLHYFPESAENVSFLENLKGICFFGMRKMKQMESPYVKVEGAWDAYLASRDKKVRKNWDYFERKICKEGEVVTTCVTDGQGLVEDLRAAFEIERSSWKGDQGSAIANSNNVSGFYLDLAQAMAASGRFELHFLLFNNKKIAFDYCLTYKDRFNVLKTGYDPEYSKSSPGRVLRKLVLKDIIGSGNYRIYDLLGARDAWKQEWTDEADTLLHIQLYNRKPIAIFTYVIAVTIDIGKRHLSRHPRLYQLVKKAYRRMGRV